MANPKVSDLLARINAQKPKEDPNGGIAQAIIASQAAMADIITRNFKGEIRAEVMAVFANEQPALIKSLEPLIAAVAQRTVDDAISSIKIPDAVVERVIERVEMVEREDDEEDAPLALTVQRKDGVIASVTMNGKVCEVIRNKQGFIKEVRERGL